MNTWKTMVKGMLMMSPENGKIGLCGFKTQNTPAETRKPEEKKEPKLSDLMRRKSF